MYYTLTEVNKKFLQILFWKLYKYINKNAEKIYHQNRK